MGMLQDFKAQDFLRKKCTPVWNQRRIGPFLTRSKRSHSGQDPDPDPTHLFWIRMRIRYNYFEFDRHGQKVPDPARSGSGSTTPAFMTILMMGPICPGPC